VEEETTELLDRSGKIKKPKKASSADRPNSPGREKGENGIISQKKLSPGVIQLGSRTLQVGEEIIKKSRKKRIRKEEPQL